MTENTTLPRLLRRNAVSLGTRPALREKRHGIWQTTTWSEYSAIVSRFASGLATHGFGRNDKLAVIGDNRPRLYAAMLAAQALGGICVPLWADAEPEWIHQVLAHAGVSVVVCEDQEQLEKILAVKHLLPDIGLVIHADARGFSHKAPPWLRSFDAIAADGAARAAVDDDEPDGLAVLLYSSGTDDHISGVMLTHGSLLAAATSLAAVEDVRSTDQALAWLPIAWIGDVLYSLTLSLMVGFPCNCPESTDTMRRDLREIGPHILLAPPRLWHSMLAEIDASAAHASPLKRMVFNYFRRIAEHAEHCREGGQRLSLSLRARYAVGEMLIYAPVRDRLGLARTRWAHSTGALLSSRVARFFRAIGLNLRESYGPAELAGLASVGSACPGSEISIAADGEILISAGTVCAGYYRDPDRTHKALTPGRQWRTGDAGWIDPDGRLVVVDRIAHLGCLANGTEFAPSTIETALMQSPYIGEAMVFGDGQEFVGALIGINRATTGNWVEKQRLADTSVGELVVLPEVRRLMRQVVVDCNAALPHPMRVRRFLLLDRGLDPADNQALLSRELHRFSTQRTHAALIASLFLDRGTATHVPDTSAAAPSYMPHLVEDVDDVGSRWEHAHA